MIERETVPCKLCGTATDMTGTKLCNPCWEVNRNFTDAHHLGLSEIACAVADAWVSLETHPNCGGAGPGCCASGNFIVSDELAAALDALASVTDSSPLRRVKP